MGIGIPWGPAWLGLLAGGTIFLGLPIARLSRVSNRTKAFLNAVSTGILIFLLVEITGHLIEQIEEMVEAAVVEGGSPAGVIRYGGLFVLGFSIGLLGLVLFERTFLGSAKDETRPGKRAKQLALMIAVGLGLHNLSEGLAIGQGYSSGAIQLAWLLAVGFALHNATEGFGIAAPLSGHRADWGFLGTCGVIAGGPTFLGAAVGSWWVNPPLEIFCLALAAGTILYIIGELLHLGRLLKGEAIVEIGLLIGFFVAMGADFALSSAMEVTAAHGPRHGGYFGDANDIYHYELVRGPDRRILLYVNDHYNRPLDAKTLQGRWILDPDGPKPLTGFFLTSPDGSHLVGDLPSSAKGGPAHLKVEVLKKGQWVGMEFYLPP
ncbi:MAG: ZIP family metal transporter [Candidatus Omnitrophica bacterium]|nr:ZIP family metal transporter [Candidatus Omnitrophota bacterium]